MAKEEVTIVKKVKNAVWYSDGTIRIERIRLSHPHVDQAKAMLDKKTGVMGKAVFGCIGMLPKKTHPEAIALLSEFNKSILKENGLEKVKADMKYIRDGDGELEDKTEYEGHIIVRTRDDRRPLVMSKSGEPITPDQAAQMFYGGCWGHLIIRPWVQKSQEYGNRLNCGLASAMFCKDDDSFGEGRISADEVKSRFADIAEDGDGDDDSGGLDNDDDDDDL